MYWLAVVIGQNGQVREPAATERRSKTTHFMQEASRLARAAEDQRSCLKRTDRGITDKALQLKQVQGGNSGEKPGEGECK